MHAEKMTRNDFDATHKTRIVYETDDGTPYTKQELIEMCDGDTERAFNLYRTCQAKHPDAPEVTPLALGMAA